MPRTYQLTAAQVITKARLLLQDDVAPYRESDPVMIGRLNDALSALLSLLPMLFSESVTHTTTAGYFQRVIEARAAELIDVVGVPACDLQTLTQFLPGWQGSAPGDIQNWLRVAGDPLSFYCVPPSVGGVSLTIAISVAPTPLAVTTDLVPVPESYEPALVDYLVSAAQLQDDEQGDHGRQRTVLARSLGLASPPESKRNRPEQPK